MCLKRYSAKLISRLRADARDSATEHQNFPNDDGDHDDDGAGSALSIGSSAISLESSANGVGVGKTYDQLRSEVTRLTAELNRVKQSELSITARYKQLVDDRATDNHPNAQASHPGHSFGMFRVEEGYGDQGKHKEEEDDGSSMASFDSAVDDGAGAADPKAIAAAAVSESARLRTELGIARAEAAAALAMEHGKRTAVAEAHRTAHATTVRQAAEIRDAQEEIVSLRRRLAFEAVGVPTNQIVRSKASSHMTVVYICVVLAVRQG